MLDLLWGLSKQANNVGVCMELGTAIVGDTTADGRNSHDLPIPWEETNPAWSNKPNTCQILWYSVYSIMQD